MPDAPFLESHFCVSHACRAFVNGAEALFEVNGLPQIGEHPEVECEDGIRYVSKRNPFRAVEISNNRLSKINELSKFMCEMNTYLCEHPKANADIAVRKIIEYAKRRSLDGIAIVKLEHRTLSIQKDESALKEAGKLDGCYVIKSDVPASLASKELLHDRHKDLSQVEWAFRTSKTGHLEMRPIFVQTEESTRGHVFVVMMSYLIVQELAKRWKALNLTVEEGLGELDKICSVEVATDGNVLCQKIPEPRESTKALLSAAGIILPEVIVASGIKVATRKDLACNRQIKRRKRLTRKYSS